MKTLVLLLASVLFTSAAHARGPSVSGGVPPHPAMTTMSIVAPEAGVDYPTDGGNAPQAVLALYNKRIPIFGVAPKLVVAVAGVDYPTDSDPYWVRYQGVLVLNKTRVPVLLGYGGDVLTWEIHGQVVIAAEILSITRAEAGIDYPTDGPPGMSRPAFIIHLLDGGRIEL